MTQSVERQVTARLESDPHLAFRPRRIKLCAKPFAHFPLFTR
jgi:hypothetical protein